MTALSDIKAAIYALADAAGGDLQRSVGTPDNEIMLRGEVVSTGVALSDGSVMSTVLTGIGEAIDNIDENSIATSTKTSGLYSITGVTLAVQLQELLDLISSVNDSLTTAFTDISALDIRVTNLENLNGGLGGGGGFG